MAYANDVKVQALDVPAALIADQGAVSEPVAQAMADGVRRRLKTDLGVGITGIAGPTGGTEAKPVALTYVARSEMVGNLARSLHIRNVVTRMLQGFIVIDAVVAALAAGWVAGLAVLALLIPTLIIARWAAMT